MMTHLQIIMVLSWYTLQLVNCMQCMREPQLLQELQEVQELHFFFNLLVFL